MRQLLTYIYLIICYSWLSLTNRVLPQISDPNLPFWQWVAFIKLPLCCFQGIWPNDWRRWYWCARASSQCLSRWWGVFPQLCSPPLLIIWLILERPAVHHLKSLVPGSQRQVYFIGCDGVCIYQCLQVPWSIYKSSVQKNTVCNSPLPLPESFINTY